MLQLFSNKKIGKLSIILDIQSGLVRGALVLDKRHIISVVTKSLYDKAHIVSTEHLTKKTLKLISEVIEHLLSNAGRSKILEINYILSSPWITARLKPVQIRYERETEMTSQILEDIVKEELRSVLSDEDSMPVEQNVFEIRLNGYPVTAVQGKKVHSLELSISTSFASKRFVNAVKTVVNKHTNINNQILHSALLMQYAALREIFKDKNEYIYIHIHRELTDLIIVKDGLCKHVDSFPFGIATLLKKIALKTGQSLEASDSLLSLYQGGKLNDNEKENVHKIVDPFMHEWMDSCSKLFESVLDVTSIPRTVYLSTHSHFDLFKQALTFRNELNFDIISYDSIDSGAEIDFAKGVVQSNTMKIYTLALSDMI